MADGFDSLNEHSIENLLLKLHALVGLRKLSLVTFQSSGTHGGQRQGRHAGRWWTLHWAKLIIGVDDQVWGIEARNRKGDTRDDSKIEFSMYEMTDENLAVIEDSIVLTPLDMFVMIHRRALTNEIYAVDERTNLVLFEIGPDTGHINCGSRRGHSIVGYMPQWLRDEHEANGQDMLDAERDGR